jgi:uncharacterized membrane protein YkvA (DUF1232 family)
MPFAFKAAWVSAGTFHSGGSAAGSADSEAFAGSSWAEAEVRTQRLAADEQTLRQRFWRKLCTLALRLPFAEDLLAAYYCAFDRQTPAHVKAALVGAIAYFVLPADLIPDVLPVIGYTDDAAMLAAAIRLVAAHITPDHREAARRKLESLRETG